MKLAFLDGSFAPAKNGGVNVGTTKKGTGTTWMRVVDGSGLPVGFHLDSAKVVEVKVVEVKVAEQTLDTIRVARPRGRPKRRPQKLVADRGSVGGRIVARSVLRSVLRCGVAASTRGQMCLPLLPKRRPATWSAKRGRPVVACEEADRQRYTVERSFAWQGNFRRLLIR